MTRQHFEETLDSLGPFETAARLALAVSGGADSLALLLLAEGWAASRGARLTVLTVDHGLRPEAAAEAGMVAGLVRARGHQHVTLTIDVPHTGGDLEAAARAARYALMARWCRAAGVLHLLTGHSRDDQAETLLMRLSRGSGLDGLAAMAPLRLMDGVRLLRPLLGIGRAELAGLVEGAGLVPVDDPMNQDPRFDRVAVRRAIRTLGLDTGGLARTAGRLRRDRQVIEDACLQAMVAALRLSPWGEGRILRPALAACPAPVAERVVGRLIATIAPAEYPPRRERLSRLVAALQSREGAFIGATLGGCRFLAGEGEIVVLREARALAADLPLEPGAEGLWDGRFMVRAGAAAVRIGPLGDAWAAGLPRIPAARRAVLPAVFAGEALIAVPAVDFGDLSAAQMRYRPRSGISA